MITTTDIAFDYSELSRSAWHIVAKQLPGAVDWQYYWPHADTKRWHAAKMSGAALCVQRRDGQVMVTLGKLKARA